MDGKVQAQDQGLVLWFLAGRGFVGGEGAGILGICGVVGKVLWI